MWGADRRSWRTEGQPPPVYIMPALQRVTRSTCPARFAAAGFFVWRLYRSHICLDRPRLMGEASGQWSSCMSNGIAPDAFAVGRVLSIELIDSGRTLDVRLEKADGTEAVLLLSQPVASDLHQQMAALLNSAD